MEGLTPRLPETTTPSVLDLFSGLGGLSVGFKKAGFEVTGADVRPESDLVFKLNRIGEVITTNLRLTSLLSDAPVVIGGPPCRPWSAVNIQRRDVAHPDRPLLKRFFKHILEIRPEVFVMENVPAVRNTASYQAWIRRLARERYNISCRRLSYAAFGAATSRGRLITVGIKDSVTGADYFFRQLARQRKPSTTVRDAIYWARTLELDQATDHVWPRLRTIGRYRDRYESGRYGWYRLSYERPAPSFGNLTKTYILHPESGENGFPLRILSVREVLCIMGFDRGFRLPRGLSLSLRYQMAAESVSPLVSFPCARVVKKMVWGSE